jgi:hypothetical protein
MLSQPQEFSISNCDRVSLCGSEARLRESRDLALLTLKEASDVLRRRIASPVELTQACLKRIERYNPALNAFIAVTAEQAITAARPMEADGMLSSRRSRRLEILRRCDATRRDSEFSSRRETQV